MSVLKIPFTRFNKVSRTIYEHKKVPKAMFYEIIRIVSRIELYPQAIPFKVN